MCQWHRMTLTFVLLILCVMCSSSGSCSPIGDKSPAVNPCSAYGDYELGTDHGVIQLQANRTANCLHTCAESGSRPPQIKCANAPLSLCETNEPIRSATCILQNEFSAKYYSCVFLDASDHVVTVERYSFEVEHDESHRECVLKHSYHVWYSQQSVKQQAFDIILGVTLGLFSLVFVLGVTLSVCYCRRKKSRDESLLYSESDAAIY